MTAARVQIPASPLKSLETQQFQGFFFAPLQNTRVTFSYEKLRSTNTTTNTTIFEENFCRKIEIFGKWRGVFSDSPCRGYPCEGINKQNDGQKKSGDFIRALIVLAWAFIVRFLSERIMNPVLFRSCPRQRIHPRCPGGHTCPASGWLTNA